MDDILNLKADEVRWVGAKRKRIEHRGFYIAMVVTIVIAMTLVLSSVLLTDIENRDSGYAYTDGDSIVTIEGSVVTLDGYVLTRSDEHRDDGVSGGAIAGLSAGAVLLVLFLVAAVWLSMRENNSGTDLMDRWVESQRSGPGEHSA